MWQYQQSTGALTSPAGVALGTGYSGNGTCMDDPESQDVTDHGPIPQGIYEIGEFFDDPGGKGPLVCHLEPDSANEMFGRSGFMIHGDNKALNHTASDGCIILARSLRQTIAGSGDHELQVVP